MRCNSAHMLNNAAARINPKLDGGAYAFSLEEMAIHIQQVRDGTATLDQFADFYMIRPEAKATPVAPAMNEGGL